MHKKVLVTGGTGYVAAHVIKLFLEKGYLVSTTIRNATEQRIQQTKQFYPDELQPNLTIEEADLLDSVEKWEQVMSGVEYLLHVASPLPPQIPKDENEIIKPAVEGTRNVLIAAYNVGVTKTVVTSSIAAVFGGVEASQVYDEQDWGNPDKAQPYVKSKILAEREVWKIKEEQEKLGKNMKICCVNPSFILGPQLNATYSTSLDVVLRIMKNNVPGIPNMYFSLVDVRDLAQAQLNIIEGDFDNQRYIINNLEMTFYDIIQVLKKEFKQYGYKFSGFRVSKCFVQFVSLFDKQLKQIVPLIDKQMELKNTKSKQELSLQYTDINKTIIDSAYSLIKQGKLINKLPK